MNTKIKVLFRHRSLGMGGVEKVLINTLKGIDKTKFDVTLLLSLNQGELRNEVPKNIHFSYLVKGKEDLSKNPIILKLQLAWRRIILWLYDAFPSITYRLKTKNNYDIEIAFSYPTYNAILKSPLKRTKKIGWLHGDLTYYAFKNSIEHLNQFDKIIYCAEKIKVKTEHAFDIKTDGIAIHNSFPINSIIEKSKTFNPNFPIRPAFISVGRISYNKGYLTLLKIHKRLINEGYQHSITLLGDGEDYLDLKKTIIENQLEDTFMLKGNQNNPYPYIKNADFFILPSEAEAYPLVVGEALILGKPVIVTNVGGVSEMVEDGINGLLTAIDEESIYQAMKRFITDKNLVDTITKNNQLAYQKFDNNKIFSQLENLIEDLYTQIQKP